MTPSALNTASLATIDCSSCTHATDGSHTVNMTCDTDYVHVLTTNHNDSLAGSSSRCRQAQCTGCACEQHGALGRQQHHLHAASAGALHTPSWLRRCPWLQQSPMSRQTSCMLNAQQVLATADRLDSTQLLRILLVTCNACWTSCIASCSAGCGALTPCLATQLFVLVCEECHGAHCLT
jgi:hypothetical protein